MSNSGKHDITLVCSDCDYTRILYHGIKNEFIISRIIIESSVSKKLLIQRRIKKFGLFTVAGQLAFQAGIVPLLRIASKGKVKNILQSGNLDISPMPENKIIRVSSINGDDFKTLVSTLQTDLIVVNGTRIISEGTLSLIKCPIINVHVGITPLYRGVHGAYWALVNKDPKHCGVTIHAIDKGIDTGGILGQDIIEPSSKDNFITYPYLQFAKAKDLLKKIIPQCLSGNISFLNPPEGKSRLWYHPAIWQYFSNRLKGIK
jgi:Formyl transferase